MSRPPYHTEHRPKQVPNYAQAAKIQHPQQQQQQQTRGGSQPSRQNNSDEHTKPGYNSNRPPANSSWQNYKNSYNKSRDYNDYTYKKSSVQLPMAPNETAPIQFGSVNQSVTTNQRNNDIPVTKPEFGLTRDSTNHYRPRPPRQEIPRSPRNTNDGRLFTQPYAPRRDYNQGDTAGGSGGNGRYNNNRYHNNNPGYNRNNNYRPPVSQTSQHSTTQTSTSSSSSPPPLPSTATTTTITSITSPSHRVNPPNATTETHTTPPIITPTTTPNSNNNPPLKPSQSPNAYHHVQIAYSPQQVPQQPSNLPPSPMSHRASPNMNPYTPKKTNLSPHMPHSSPQSIQMTSAGWSPAGQYFYPHQYPVPVASFPVVTTTSRSPIIPPPTTRKAIAIIDPATGTAVNTSPMSLTSHPHPQHQKEEKHFDFKVPAVSKPVVIVDPAIRDRELREKKEREEAEQEAKRKEEEEAAEKARKAKEEEEERERLAKEEEQKRLQKEAEEAEEAEKERLEKERLENERLAAAAAAAAAEAVERQRQEEEALRKIEEENESRRVINELEADRKRQEEKKKQAKIIQDPSTIEYPPGIKAPAASPEGTQRHVYSIDFLLQFQQICLDTDEEVSNIIQRELSESNTAGSNRLGMGSSMRQPSDRGKNPPRTPGGTNLSPDTMFKMGSRDGRMEMGKFNMGRPLTARNNSQYMERQGSMGRGGSMMSRGGGRGGGSGGMKIIRNPPQQQPMNGSSFEPVTPLEKSENRWVPSVIASSAAQPPAEGELMSQEYIVRKVNALLNKLTLEKFDTITPQIFEYARQSAKEDDGRSLHTVMQLVFEKACDEPAFANMWARLCHYMYNSMTDDIKDVTLLNEQKKPSSGVLLFRKYLFNRCQQEFEKGWKVNMPEVDETDGVLSDEYYAAVKAKRQGLGLIQFIGELFKLDMLSERIMYNCMIKLCNDPRNAGDEEAESLCKLLTTIGKALDSRPKTTKWVDIIIERMKNDMIHSPKLTSRVKFMIQDLLDLRKDKWVPRFAGNQVGPTTIAKIHEMAEKAKEEKEAAAMKRNNNSRGPYIPNNNNNQYNNNYNNMSRTGSYRSKDSHFHHHNNNNSNNTTSDGWSTVSQGGNNMGSNNTNKTRPNELSNFGKMDRSRSKTSHLGPTHSPFAMLKNKSSSNLNTSSANDGRSSSPATNMFSALENGSEQSEERKKPQLESHASNESETSTKLSDEVVKRKSKNILEEYFNIRDKNELVECVKELDDPSYLIIFVSEMLNVVEKKAQDVEDMSDTIQYLCSERLLDRDTLVNAFKSFMEGYDDLTIDVPQAPKHVAQLLAAASLLPEEVGGEEFSSLQNAYKAVVDSQA